MFIVQILNIYYTLQKNPDATGVFIVFWIRHFYGKDFVKNLVPISTAFSPVSWINYSQPRHTRLLRSYATSFSPEAEPLFDGSIKGMTGVEAHLHRRSLWPVTQSDTRQDWDKDHDPCQSSLVRFNFFDIPVTRKRLKQVTHHVYIQFNDWLCSFLKIGYTIWSN